MRDSQVLLPRSARKHAAGFSLVELLVVIAMVGILVALLMPAVQAAREAARRAQCANNLKQLGLALHTFDHVHQFWPPGAISGAVPTVAHQQLGLPAGPEHSWCVLLLPYLEQQVLHDRYQFTADWRAPANQAVRETRLPMLQCPSVPNPQRLDQATSGGFSWRSAPTDYGAVSGVEPVLFSLGLIDYSTSRYPAGMLRTNQIQPASEMTDGASNQLVVAEDAGRHVRFVARRRVLMGGRYTGGGWADRDNSYSVHGASLDGLTSPGPCPMNCTNNNEVYSFHPGGAAALFGDGSVRFLVQQIEMRVLGAVLSCQAGETLQLP